MLSQAVKPLVFSVLKNLTEGIAVSAIYPYRGKLLAASVLFPENDIPLFIRKPYLSCLSLQAGPGRCRTKRNGIPAPGNLKSRDRQLACIFDQIHIFFEYARR